MTRVTVRSLFPRGQLTRCKSLSAAYDPVTPSRCVCTPGYRRTCETYRKLTPMPTLKPSGKTDTRTHRHPVVHVETSDTMDTRPLWHIGNAAHLYTLHPRTSCTPSGWLSPSYIRCQWTGTDRVGTSGNVPLINYNKQLNVEVIG